MKPPAVVRAVPSLSSKPGDSSNTASMDDLEGHFFITVGHVLDHAAVGRLRVRLELSDGGVAEGVPSGWEGSAGDELDDTGYPRRVRLGADTVALDDVRRVTVSHPGGAG